MLKFKLIRFSIILLVYFLLRCAHRTDAKCKGGENSESERHTGYCFVLLAVEAPRLKTR